MVAIFNNTTFDFEDFDEEIVLIHMQSGVYYTLKGSGPAILRVFQNGCSTEDIKDFLVSRANPEWSRNVDDFLAQLLAEDILIPTDMLPSVQPDLSSLTMQEMPILEKFDDVSDLIKLDPIHDVSDLGWPNKK